MADNVEQKAHLSVKQWLSLLGPLKEWDDALTKIGGVTKALNEKQARLDDLKRQEAGIQGRLDEAERKVNEKLAKAMKDAEGIILRADAERAKAELIKSGAVKTAEELVREAKETAQALLAEENVRLKSLQADLLNSEERLSRLDDEIDNAEADLADAQKRKAEVEAELARLKSLFGR